MKYLTSLILIIFTFQAQENQPQKEMIPLEELQLDSIKKLLGWQVNGVWSTEGEFLELGEMKDSSFILSNFFPLNSEIVQYYVQFQMNFDSRENKPAESIKKSSVLVFGFSPYMHDTRDFSSPMTTSAAQGYLVYFFEKDNEGIVLLRKIVNPEMVDFQDVHKMNIQKFSKNSYCKFDFKNQVIKLVSETNFKTNTFRIFLNDQICIQSDIDQNAFGEQKVGIIIGGYSSNIAPMKVQIQKLYPYKYSYSVVPVNATFHYNTNNFLYHYDQQDEKDQNKKDKNLADLMLMQKKYSQTYDDIQKVIEMMAKKQQIMDQIMEQEFSKNKDVNFVSSDKEMSQKLDSKLTSLEELIRLNQKSDNLYQQFSGSLEKVNTLMNIVKETDQLEQIFDSLNQFMDMEGMNQYVEQIVKLSEDFQKGEVISQVDGYLTRSISSISMSPFLKSLAFTIVILSILLIFMIIRKIDYREKTHSFNQFHIVKFNQGLESYQSGIGGGGVPLRGEQSKCFDYSFQKT